MWLFCLTFGFVFCFYFYFFFASKEDSFFSSLGKVSYLNGSQWKTETAIRNMDGRMWTLTFLPPGDKQSWAGSVSDSSLGPQSPSQGWTQVWVQELLTELD